MSAVDFLVDIFRENLSSPAMIWNEYTYSYEWLADAVSKYRDMLREKIADLSVVALYGDFSPDTVAMLIALIAENRIIVPISSVVVDPKKIERIAEVQVAVNMQSGKIPIMEMREVNPNHMILRNLVRKIHPGLILFSSGSTGEPKAAVHDFVSLLSKFRIRRPALRTISFLLFDHIGGVNTLLHVLSNAGTLVVPDKRTPDYIVELIEKHRVELLPTSPSFLNLLLMSGELQNREISSLKMITYGTEPMPEATLKAIHRELPNVRLKQTYGLSEIGIMRTKSESADSLWMKAGGEDYETRIVDGILQIKAKTAMLGYLNAPSPFTADGWFDTGDRVEVKDDWIKILGRDSDLINVGGEKVYPAEVESALLSIPNVKDAVVFGTSNPLLGSIVAARVVLNKEESLRDFKKHMRSSLTGILEPYKLPSVVEIVDSLTSARFKRLRG